MKVFFIRELVVFPITVWYAFIIEGVSLFFMRGFGGISCMLLCIAVCFPHVLQAVQQYVQSDMKEVE